MTIKINRCCVISLAQYISFKKYIVLNNHVSFFNLGIFYLRVTMQFSLMISSEGILFVPKSSSQQLINSTVTEKELFN